jgi:2,4-dienoyl-CoA reductase-like NADH-dependent reductase (Old Yellow Enzyme family)
LIAQQFDAYLVFLERISATEWLEEVLPNEPSWTVQDTIRLSAILAEHGVDLLDVSSAGNSPLQKFRFNRPAFQSELSEEIKRALNREGVTVAGTGAPFLVGAVGGISTGALATEVLDEEWADVVFVGRYFQQNPGLVWQFARELGVEIQLPNQIGWAFKGRGSSLRQQDESEKRA